MPEPPPVTTAIFLSKLFMPISFLVVPFPSLAALLDQQPYNSSEVTASTHHAPSASWARSPSRTTKDSQPQVMLSTASARKARLPSASAICNLRRDRSHMIGIAARLTNRPGQENSALRVSTGAIPPPPLCRPRAQTAARRSGLPCARLLPQRTGRTAAPD